MIRYSSVFSDINVLGTKKDDFIAKFGKPFNTDMKEDNGKLVEGLYYVEVIDRIAITTKFIFVDGTLVEQTNHKLDFESQEIKKLEGAVRCNRLENIRRNSINH